MAPIDPSSSATPLPASVHRLVAGTGEGWEGLQRRLTDRGWLLLQGLKQRSEASRIFKRIVRGAVEGHFLRSAGDRLRFNPPARMPECSALEGATFQALHFDFGAPIVSVAGPSQFTCLFTGLYFPGNERPGVAETRIVTLPSLLTSMDKTIARRMLARLPHYVRVHGDGWSFPEPFRTGRLACLARFFDAASRRPKLGHFHDQDTSAWFREGAPSPAGEDELARETAWFAGWGLALDEHEERVRLRPGELLIIDNLTTCHGRLGPRRMRELYAMNVGIASTSAAHCDRFREYLTSLTS